MSLRFSAKIAFTLFVSLTFLIIASQVSVGVFQSLKLLVIEFDLRSVPNAWLVKLALIQSSRRLPNNHAVTHQNFHPIGAAIGEQIPPRSGSELLDSLRKIRGQLVLPLKTRLVMLGIVRLNLKSTFMRMKRRRILN